MCRDWAHGENYECLSLSKLNNEIADGLFLFSSGQNDDNWEEGDIKDSKGGKTGTKVDSQKKAGNGQGKNSAEIDNSDVQ